MKKSILYSVLLFVAVAFSSCDMFGLLKSITEAEAEAESEGVTEEILIGKWRTTSLRAEKDGEVMAEEAPSDDEDRVYPLIWEFFKDGHMEVDGSNELGLTYSLNEDGTVLYCTDSGEVISYDICKVSNKVIELSWIYDESFVPYTQVCVLTKQ